MSGKLIIFSAPSGSGKSTIINWLMSHKELRLSFSISCTSRKPRGGERNGVEYFFITPEEFRQRIERGEFIEYEEVYKDRFYGTLRSQVDKQMSVGDNIVLDVDVKGGINIKSQYGSDALSIFIMPPSIEELRKRLEKRGTESADVISQRIERAEFEIGLSEKFDHIVINDKLEEAEKEALRLAKSFLENHNSLS